jgi:hypothetical protein
LAYNSGMFEQAFARTRGAWLAGFVFCLCVLLIWPVCESGINDDWSVVRSAQVFAQTGHIHFNAWEAPLCLWNIWTGGLAIRILGFSYFVVRLSTALQALVLVLLFQRCCVRSGLPERMATFVTLCLTLSPVFLGCGTQAMSDIVGLLSLVTCLYGCLRSLQAETVLKSGLWLVFATATNLAISSSRQIDFIGSLVMLPCAVYLLRERRWMIALGSALWLFSIAYVSLLLRWFSRQPYILPQSLIPHPLKLWMLIRGPMVLIYGLLDCFVLIFPAFLLLARSWKSSSIRAKLAVFCFALLFAIINHRYARHQDIQQLSPFYLITFYLQSAENTFNSMAMSPKGLPPAGLALGARLLFTLMAFFAAASCVLAWAVGQKQQPRPSSERLPMRELLILVLPVLTIYGLMILPRGVLWIPPDRYLLGCFPFGLIILGRYCMRHFGSEVPWYAWGAVFVMGAYSVATVHDIFSTLHANLRAIDELRAKGITRQAIDGGFEYNADTQILDHGYTEASGTTRPGGRIHLTDGNTKHGPCAMIVPTYTPDVHPIYAVAWPDTVCRPVPGFAPVTYTAYLPPFRRQLHIVWSVPSVPADLK